MRDRMLHGRMLRYLDEVARTGSIRRAAARLNVASSAINRQILALEASMGATIFERMPRRLRLTAAGELLIDHIRKTLKDFDRVSARMDALKGEQAGRVAFATTFGLTVGPLRPIVSHFLDRHPQVQIELRGLVADAIPAAVASGEVDVALSYNLKPDPALRSLLSLEVPPVAVVGVRHPLAGRDPVHIAEVATYPLVLPVAGMSIRDLLDGAFTQLSIKVRPLLETNSIELINQLVAEPPRATFLNPLDAIMERRRGELVFVPLTGYHLKPQRVEMVARASSPLDTAVNLFIEEMRNELVTLVEQVNREFGTPSLRG